MRPRRYVHVDVFSPLPFRGNSLAVFPDARGLSAEQMALITREMRHFESAFLEPAEAGGAHRTRVFDLAEELDFAGHPVIGAACVLHASAPGLGGPARWTMALNARTVVVTTERKAPGRYAATLDQGPAEFIAEPGDRRRAEIASWFGLAAGDLDPELPPGVVSTGLRYLVVPTAPGALPRARIVVPDLDAKLQRLGAQFAYLIDAAALEGRHWNNDGLMEDVATGSGAGCAAAWLRRWGRIADGREAILRQGRFVGRPSEITIRAHGEGRQVTSVEVGGDVSIVGEGVLTALPRPGA